MSTIVTRSGKGSPLTHVEVDANFTNLNTDKAEKASNLSDLTSASTARTNLGLPASATTDTTNASNISSGTLAAARLPALVGDASSSAGSSTLTLATVNSNTGAFGSSSSIPVITVNGKGLITAVSTATASSLPSQTGNSGKYLTTDGSAASWGTVTASTATNLAGGALGSVPYQLLSGTTTFLSGNTTTTPQFLTSTGVLGVATAPAYTGSTGSGNVVLATSPTLVTPVLGTPSSGTLTNCTFPTLNQNTTGTASNVTGTVAVANGGTGLTSTPTNGQLNIGNGTGFTRATLTAGTGVSVTNASGSITLANTGVTSIVAGTGISISGATGAVTVTNSVSVNTSQLAKAWVVFTGQGSATILNSYNVSSVTRTGTGGFTIAFTTAMPTANYSTNVTNGFNGSGNDWSAWYAGAATTANVKCQFATPTITAAQDPSYVNLTVNSN